MAKKSSIEELVRLIEIIKFKKDITQETISQELGYNPTYISQALSRGQVSAKFINRIKLHYADILPDEEVIEVSLSDALATLTEKQLLLESMMRVCLKVQAEMWAVQRNVPVTQVLDEITQAVRNGTLDSLDGL